MKECEKCRKEKRSTKLVVIAICAILWSLVGVCLAICAILLWSLVEVCQLLPSGWLSSFTSAVPATTKIAIQAVCMLVATGGVYLHLASLSFFFDLSREMKKKQ